MNSEICSLNRSLMAASHQWLEFLIDGLSGPENTRPHGSDRAVHGFGDRTDGCLSLTAEQVENAKAGRVPQGTETLGDFLEASV